MFQRSLIALACILAAPSPAFSEAPKHVVAIVNCINAVNGFPRDLSTAEWDLSQAVWGDPAVYGDDDRMLDDYYLIGGRRLGWHGTWQAVLHLNPDQPTAYEGRSKHDSLGFFGSSFVPQSVIDAFKSCNVTWGEYWPGDMPIMVVDSQEVASAPVYWFYEMQQIELLPPTE